MFNISKKMQIQLIRHDLLIITNVKWFFHYRGCVSSLILLFIIYCFCRRFVKLVSTLSRF